MRRVYKMTRYAYENVPMYIRLAEKLGIDVCRFSDEELWKAVPPIEKTKFIESGSACISVKYINKLYNNELLSMRTSGSTGMYMDINWDYADYNRSMLPLWMLRRRYYNISPSDKMIYFFTLSKCGKLDTESEINHSSMGISKLLLNNDKIFKAYKLIMQYKPRWMLLQPSVALSLLFAKRKYNLPKIISLEYIELTGEYISNQAEKEIKEGFECKVANQYGCIEGNSIAYECPYGNMHLMHDNVHMDVVDNTVYITTLTNHAMPFIKYGLGDSVVIEHLNYKCSCGCITPVIKVMAGRMNDYIQLTDNKYISSSCIHKVFDTISYATDGEVLQYKVYQTANNEFDVYVVIDEDNEIVSYIEDMIRAELSKILGDVVVNMFVSDALLPNEITGKMKIFECLI